MYIYSYLNLFYMRSWTIRDQRSSTGGASQGLIKPFFPGGVREGSVRWTVVIKFHIGELGQTMRGSGYCSDYMATTPSDSGQGKQALNNLTRVTTEKNQEQNKQTNRHESWNPLKTWTTSVRSKLLTKELFNTGLKRVNGVPMEGPPIPPIDRTGQRGWTWSCRTMVILCQFWIPKHQNTWMIR